MRPLKLTAPCKDYIWGGTRLRDEYGKLSEAERIAESWELSCHPDGESVITDGEYAGKTLADYIKSEGKGVLGKNCERFGRFPIIIKLIDAADNLSVQVHPNDAQGKRDGDWGKTEMWHVVDCEPQAELIYGFNREITREEFKARIENNTLLDVVNRVKVKKGDVFFIPAGTLHAIGKGILIAEIQQNSNLTYRVYDYGRLGADGKPRELHIEKAVGVTDLKPPAAPFDRSSCEYFNVRKSTINGGIRLKADENTFSAVLVLENEIYIDDTRLKKGETCFIPAGFGDYTIKGISEIIITDIPDGSF